MSTRGSGRGTEPIRAAAGPTVSASRPVVLVEAGFQALARLRRAPALHPQGLTCTGELEVLGDGCGPWDVPWLDMPRRLAATARLSRAVGLPRRLPDGLGLAIRVADADGPGGTLDLLMTSSGRGRAGRHLPLPRADAQRGLYSSLLPYRVAGRSCLLAAIPRRTRQARVPGDPEGVAAALAAGPLVYDLCAETGDRSWRRFAVLTVRDILPMDRENTLDFDPHAHSARAFTPGPALAAIRRAAYRGSRVGRGGRREVS
ncbi:phosphodiesterase [Streptomyces sp. DH8]|uniref:phosphodiesterase n=1 Tax=Streptomyces sp. DH8 TaxID=2857008 RepID=UPI001E4DED60|nr:phosphodiesterase [Streptomyces sp. DH8]